MSYESTVEYYKIINEEINKRLKGLHSAKMFMESYDFDEIERLQKSENWSELTKILINSAKKLENQGADLIAIATNTMHLMADDVQKNIKVPLIHITNACANYIKQNNFDTVLLLGTKYTMTKPFYKDKLKNEFKINVILPNQDEQDKINNIIYNELCVGIINEKSKESLLKIIENYDKKAAKAVVLGCTELPNIIKKASIPLIDTTKVHCIEIVNQMLN